jgi:hypothetical protein
MAKHVTEDDLASGLSGFGDGLSTITEKRPRRDNPFRDSRSEGSPRPSEDKVVEMRPPAEATVPLRSERDPREDLLERARAVRAQTTSKPLESEGREPLPPLPVRVPTIEESARQVRVTYPDPEPQETPPVRKADIFTERVTLSVSTEMRDAVEALAREIQRRRTRKDERITANTIMRVAINSFLDSLELEDGDIANSEAELLALARIKAASR